MTARFYRFGPFCLDAKGPMLLREGRVIPLAPKVASTLLLLVENAGSVVDKQTLLKEVWPDSFIEEGSLTRSISLLRKALDDSSNGQEYISTMSKRGYRFVAPVEVTEENPAAPPTAESPTDSSHALHAFGPSPVPAPGPASQPSSLPELVTGSTAKPRTRRPKLMTISLVAAVVFALALAYYPAKRFLAGPSRPTGRLMIAVLPFQNLTGDSTQEFVSDGLTEEMITRLGGLNYEQLGVISRTSAMAYKGSAKPASQIGDELGVNYILEGSVRSWGKRVRITAQLIQTSDQTHIWSQSYDRDMGDILALQSEVAQAIAKEINVKLAPEARERLANVHPINPEAYEAYLKGRYLWNQRTEDSMRKGIEYFNQAIAHDPGYAPAYVGLADSYALLALRGIVPANDVFPKAKGAVRKALEIDNGLGEAHATLAHIRLHDWDWAGLDEEFKRAIELNPGNAFTYPWHAEYLMAVGRAEEAIATVKKAVKIDPVSSVLATTLPHTYYFAGRYDEAIGLLRKSLEVHPNHFFIHFRLGQIYIQKGMNREAIQEMQKAVDLSRRSTETLTGLAQAYAAAGMQKEMQDVVAELDRNSSQHYVSAYNLSKIYASLGDPQQTFAWLEKAYSLHDPDLIELKAEPAFARFRSDPRFVSLLGRVGWSS